MLKWRLSQKPYPTLCTFAATGGVKARHYSQRVFPLRASLDRVDNQLDQLIYQSLPQTKASDAFRTYRARRCPRSDRRTECMVTRMGCLRTLRRLLYWTASVTPA
jgi:hypothetical protein